MRVRSLVAAVAILWGLGLRAADASPKGDIQTKIKEAMENYDLMDYDAARKLLNQALAIAKKHKLDKDSLVAKAHISLAIVEFNNKDTDAARLSFLSAVQIDPKITIDPAYKTAEMAKLLEQARKDATGSGQDPGPGRVTKGGGSAVDSAPPTSTASSVDCSGVKGLQHTIIDTAKANTALAIEAFVAGDVSATKIAVMYRPEKAADFRELKLKKDGDCRYTGSIPASAMKGSLVFYYVAAFNEYGKAIAGKGTSGSPNIIELTAGGSGGAVAGDKEDPFSGGGGEGGGIVSSEVTVAPRRPRVMVAMSAGTGFGYVSGQTEANNEVKNCCLGNSWVVLQPEVGYFVNPQLIVGIAARIGFPIGANVEGHATAAPGAVVRARYALDPSGEGLRVMGQLGAGVMRNTIKLDNSEPGMDTDVVAQGPLLIGGGAGFTKRLSGTVSVIADLSVLIGIAVVGSIGPAPVLNNGFGADLSLGLEVGF